MLLLLIIILPLLTGVSLMLIKNALLVKRTALLSSLVVLVLTLIMWYFLRINKSDFLQINIPWISNLGIRFHLGIDGLSLFMLLLTNILFPIIIYSGIDSKQKQAGVFYGLLFIAQAGLIGMFAALNAVLFYVCWEIVLIPIYFILLIWGGENRQNITLKFFLYTLFGSLLMLFAFVYIYFQTPGIHSFEWSSFVNLPIDTKTQSWLFWCVFIAFAVKMPLFPFHSWMPETYNTAPTQGTMLLAGIMMKMGIYGAIRWLIPVLPLGVYQNGSIAMIFAIIGIIYGSWIALKQKNIKMLIAFSSMAHAGLMGAAILTGNMQAIQGAVLQMLSHGLNIIGLFFIVHIIEQRTRTYNIDALGGIKNEAPKLAALFMIIMLGNIALPLTNGFIGEFLMLTGIFQYNAIYTLLAGTTIIMSAIYMLYMFQKIMLGANVLGKGIFLDLSLREAFVLVPIAVLVIFIGIYPTPLLHLTESAVHEIVNLSFQIK